METTQCNNCAWYYSDEEYPTCEAFAPGKIPREILTGEVSHTKPVPGQTDPNIVYLPIIED